MELKQEEEAFPIPCTSAKKMSDCTPQTPNDVFFFVGWAYGKVVSCFSFPRRTNERDQA
jgi:hypothetical protein